MTETAGMLTPTVAWAQRRDIVFLTVEVEDSTNFKLEIEDAKLSFSCQGGDRKKPAKYAFTVELYGPMTSEGLKEHRTDKRIEYEIRKAPNPPPAKATPNENSNGESSEKSEAPAPTPKKGGVGWWPRFQQGSKKPHWVRTDFNKWKDEDDSDDEGGRPGGGGWPGGMGGMGMGGMGMGGMGMGGMGMGGMGMGGMGGMGGWDDDGMSDLMGKMGGDEDLDKPDLPHDHAHDHHHGEKKETSSDSDDEKVPDLEG